MRDAKPASGRQSLRRPVSHLASRSAQPFLSPDPMPAPSPLRVLLVAGARPNFMKIAPVLRALRERGHAPVLVHTGQHYDVQMSDAFFRDLELPAPDHSLGV